jgi:hypothetical protein
MFKFLIAKIRSFFVADNNLSFYSSPSRRAQRKAFKKKLN